jgi:hypothetical protein
VNLAEASVLVPDGSSASPDELEVARSRSRLRTVRVPLQGVLPRYRGLPPLYTAQVMLQPVQPRGRLRSWSIAHLGLGENLVARLA